MIDVFIGIITQVGAPAAPLSHSGNDGLVPLKIMDISLGTLKKVCFQCDICAAVQGLPILPCRFSFHKI